MLAFDIDGRRFQVRAGALLRHQGRWLLHRAPADAYWSLPGGRVDPGETAAQTVVRELQEELGVAATAGPLLVLVENFFALGNRPFHELNLVVEAQLPDGHPLLALEGDFVGDEAGSPLVFRWFPAEALPGLDIRPQALQQLVAAPDTPFLHLVQQDRHTPA